MNNINAFAEYMDHDQIYYLQVITRSKDGHDNRLIAEWYVNKDKLLFLYPILTEFHLKFGARVYITINPTLRDFKFDYIKRIIGHLEIEKFDPISVYRSEFIKSGQSGKRWLIDIDDPSLLDQVLSHIEMKGIEIHLLVPTRAGFHLIVNKMNRQEWPDFGVNVTIKTKNPSLLLI